jgi:hypothetical protein
MRTLLEYLSLDPPPFEEWIKVIFSLSEKIYENALKGIVDKGDTNKGEMMFVMISEKGEKESIHIHSTGRVISPIPFPESVVEQNYKATVDSLIRFYYQTDMIVIPYLSPLKWKFSDNDNMYYRIIMQTIEFYVAGGVPKDTDITLASGGLPRNCFKKPISYGKEYYEKESATGPPLPPWDLYVNLNEKIPEQEKNKKEITFKLASRYISRFFFYLWSYRICFRGKESLEKFKFLGDRSTSLLHQDVFALADSPKGQISECKSEWIIHSYLGEGSFGEVFRACCEKNCEYAIKIVKPGNELTPFLEKREIAMWKKVQELDLCPRLVEYYHHKGVNHPKHPEEDYFILVMEACDMSIKYAMTNIINTERNDVIRRDLRKLIFEKIRDILLKLHSNNIAHSDAHFENYMLKCNNKEVFKSAGLLFQAIQNGQCQVKIIDFGYTTTLELLNTEFDSEIRRLFPIINSKRLFSIGCLPDKYVKQPLNDPLFISQDRGKKLFDILCFYDFSEMVNAVDDHWSNAVEFLSMIIPLQKAIIGTNCRAGRPFND